jgi:hypothetical protein
MFAFAQNCADEPYADLSPAQRLKALAADAEIQKEELMILQKETVRALQLHNSGFFNRVYSDDFIGTLPSGRVQDKAALIASVQTSTEKYASFVATDIRVRIFQSTAVVTCLWSSLATSNGTTVARQTRVVNVYVRNDRGWKVVASQETQLPG